MQPKEKPDRQQQLFPTKEHETFEVSRNPGTFQSRLERNLITLVNTICLCNKGRRDQRN